MGRELSAALGASAQVQSSFLSLSNLIEDESAWVSWDALIARLNPLMKGPSAACGLLRKAASDPASRMDSIYLGGKYKSSCDPADPLNPRSPIRPGGDGVRGCVRMDQPL